MLLQFTFTIFRTANGTDAFNALPFQPPISDLIYIPLVIRLRRKFHFRMLKIQAA